MYRCTCWLARAANGLTRRGGGIVILFLIAAIHPFIHGLEGGTLDAVLMNLQAWAAANVTVGAE